ncbi:UNVERIFIED_CONTAM: hypothetical protein GTU68_018651 [Idotea baltica]|nr:hypothetical protein [Idotea baltica]
MPSSPPNIFRVGVCQLSASDDPQANLPRTEQAIREVAAQGAVAIFTPEVTNCVSTSKTRQTEVLQREEDDQTLKALQELAAELKVSINIGSLALKSGDPDGRFVNRSFFIDAAGQITARYDKMHMFDVTVSEAETYTESKSYRPGSQAVLVNSVMGDIGLSICYDLRFPHLYRALAQKGALTLTVPSAFSLVTGTAHWEPLLRARAIENGAYVIAAAQCGQHILSKGKPRATYGHSMVVDPWGEALMDLGPATSVGIADIDLAKVYSVRRRLPSLSHDRDFDFAK